MLDEVTLPGEEWMSGERCNKVDEKELWDLESDFSHQCHKNLIIDWLRKLAFQVKKKKKQGNFVRCSF